MSERSITGNLVNAYFVCKRKVWLFAHEISPSLENPYLEIGRLIGEESYKRAKKEILAGNLKIDMIEKENGKTVIAEIKKSSKGKSAAKMQLLFYLYKLKQQGIEAKGELLIPKERKRIEVELTEEKEKELEKTFDKIKEILRMGSPPPPERISFCKNCAYNEFCWT